MTDVTFTPNHMPPPACYPSDTNGLLDLLTTGGGLTGTIPDNAGGGIFVGSSPPPSALTNKVWFKTDEAGRPTGVYMFYNGNWRKVYTGVTIGEIRMIWFYSGFFDGSGRGTIGGEYDGWAICNGQNGTPNLEGYFLAGGAPGETIGGAAGLWYTLADGVAWNTSGGQRGRITLTMANFPDMAAQTCGAGGHWAAGGDGGSLLLQDCGTYPSSPAYWTVHDANGNRGQSQPLPFQNLYQAIGYLMFVGYI